MFTYDGNAVRPGYHITEVKAGQFSALDCGANPEAWAEIFVQLWDIDEDGRTHMPAGKFAGIIRNVSDHVQLEPTAKLTFEVSDGERLMALYCASAPRHVAGTFEVSLAARLASCKPRDRWLVEETAAKDKACCTPSQTSCCSL
ncbi:hypothetical protein D3C80_1609900 [compost metagenome]